MCTCYLNKCGEALVESTIKEFPFCMAVLHVLLPLFNITVNRTHKISINSMLLLVVQKTCYKIQGENDYLQC